MKIKYFRLRNWLLATAAGLFGLNAGCDAPVEYGCPTADYEVKGRVTTQDDVPIEGIAVSRNERYYSYTSDTTDADGRYYLRYSGFPIDGDTVEVYFSDIDGEANGSYADTMRSVVFYQSDLHGGDGHWYEGRATKVVDVKLREVE